MGKNCESPESMFAVCQATQAKSYKYRVTTIEWTPQTMVVHKNQGISQCFTCLISIVRSFLGQQEKKYQKISASFAHAQALIFDIFFLVDPKTNALW